MKKKLLTGLAIGLMGLCVINSANADTAAFNVTGLDGGFNYYQSPGVIGNGFLARSAITVTQLGAYDSNVTKMLATSFPGQSYYSYHGAEIFQNNAVGLYDVSTHTLVASATVTGTDTLIGDFRYAALTTPVSLNTTDTYAIVSQNGSNYYLVGANPNGVIGSEINWMGGAYNTGNSLVEPIVTTGANIFGNTSYDPNTFLGDFGANFLYAPANNTGPSSVPEPATILLFGAGLAGFAGLRLRRKK